MGSAVVKPLTRRRGKVKPNEEINSANGNREENDGESNVNSKVDPLADPCSNLCKSNAKLPRVEGDIAKAVQQVGCTNVTVDKASKQFDSDEEPNPIALACNERSNVQTFHKGTNSSTIAEQKHVSNLSSTCTNRPDVNHVHTTRSSETANIPPKTKSAQKLSETVRCQLRETRPGVKTASPHGLTPEIDIEDQDVSRDARTPSPEYDDLEDVKVINPNPLEQSASSPLECYVHVPESKNPPCAGDVGVSISKTDHPAPERKGEHRMELGHVIFIQPSPSKESNMDQQQGDGENVPLNRFSPVGTTLKSSPCKTKSEDMCCKYGGDSTRKKHSSSHGNTSFSANVNKMKCVVDGSLRPGAKDEIHPADSFEDAMEAGRCSHKSSVTSITGTKCKQRSQTDIGENLSLNSPQVEEVLATGEDFMDGLDECYVKRNQKQPSAHELRNDALSAKLDSATRKGELTSPRPGAETLGKEGIRHAKGNESNSENTLLSSSPKLFCLKLPKIGRSKSSMVNSEGTQSAGNSRPTSGSTPPDPANESSQRANDSDASRQTPSSRSSSAKSAQQNSRPLSAAKQNSRHDKMGTTAPTPVSSRTSNKSNSLPPSVKESTQGGKQIRSKPNSASSSKSSSRASTPRAGYDLGGRDMAPNRISSRPPSAKPGTHISETTQPRSRPNSGKPSATTSDPSQLNVRPSSSHSRRNLNTTRPRSGLDKLSQLDVEQCTEGMGVRKTDTAGSRSSQNSPMSEGRSALKGGGEQTNEKGRRAEPTCGTPPSVTARSATELTSEGKDSPGIAENEMQAPFIGSCCFPKPELTHAADGTRSPADMTVSSTRSSASLKVSSVEIDEDCAGQEKPPSRCQTGSPYQILCPPTDKANTGKKWPTGDVIEVEPANSQPNTLSQDQIGSIRKQLYEEGLKPAERDGGVAFFIPVTEDGLQPQANNITITERLTKSKRSSLNYEERMILANINRQVQLTKRKEFALRDLRNVKGATSSDGYDKNKADDDLDTDFDSSF